MFQIHIWYTDLLFFYYEARPVNFEWDLFIESVASGTQPSRINIKINKKIWKDEKSTVFASTGSRHNLGQKLPDIRKDHIPYFTPQRIKFRAKTILGAVFNNKGYMTTINVHHWLLLKCDKTLFYWFLTFLFIESENIWYLL